MASSHPAGVGSITANEFFTPVIVPRTCYQDMEGNLSFSGDLRHRHFRPLPLNEDVLAKHRQLESPLGALCIPMVVEFVLKLEGKVPPEDFRLQNGWKESPDANFSKFDGKAIERLKFKRQFSDPRGDKFPLDDLFSTIEQEPGSSKICDDFVRGRGWQLAQLRRLQSATKRGI